MQVLVDADTNNNNYDNDDNNDEDNGNNCDDNSDDNSEDNCDDTGDDSSVVDGVVNGRALVDRCSPPKRRRFHDDAFLPKSRFFKRKVI